MLAIVAVVKVCLHVVADRPIVYGQKALDFRAALSKLSDDTVILYWHPAKPSSAIAFITATRKEILAQKKANAIDALIKSKLLTQDEQALQSFLWWSLTVPPDFDSRIRGRLPDSADQATFKSVVGQAACWVLSETSKSE